MKKILLADDSITIQKVVELTFSEEDYQVVCVGNGAQALKKVSEWRPNIVLLDVIMPEKNGYEVCEEMKRNPSTSSIPVLLLTGTFEPFDQKRADAAGAGGHLTKPFESQTLVSKVEELLADVPHVSEGDPAGMDIVSGGTVYHVPAAEEDDAPSPAGTAAGEAGAATSEAPPPPEVVAARAESPLNALNGDDLISDESTPQGKHPALQQPDPGEGGSYVGFADLDVEGAAAPEIVPDRFDERTPAGATARVQRDALLSTVAPPPEGHPPPEAEDPLRHVSGEPIEGLTGAFEQQEPRAETRPGHPPPPMAKSVETGREDEVAPETISNPPGDAPEEAGSAAAQPFGSGGDGGQGPVTLTPEAIDLIAERVVQRISDRVVREIAWDVVPHMAETVVRQRIKELEEKDQS